MPLGSASFAVILTSRMPLGESPWAEEVLPVPRPFLATATSSSSRGLSSRRVDVRVETMVRGRQPKSDRGVRPRQNGGGHAKSSKSVRHAANRKSVFEPSGGHGLPQEPSGGLGLPLTYVGCACRTRTKSMGTSLP